MSQKTQHAHTASDVSVIIPVFDGGTAFKTCLESIVRCCPPPGEIIIVDDGDCAGTKHIAENYGIKPLTITGPRGPATARNIGAENSSGTILFFLDADVVVLPDIVGRVSVLFREREDIAAAFGSYDDAPADTNFLSQYRNLLHHYVHQSGHEDASTFWGACGAIRREIFIKAGGFDERFGRPSIEDIELGYRLKASGYRILLMKDLQVTHLKRWTIRSLLYTDLYCRALPWTRLILRKGSFINDLNLKNANRASVFLAWLFLFFATAGCYFPWFPVPAAVAASALVVLNLGLYRFFHEKHGLLFTIKSIFWHWLHFLYSGLAFIIGVVEYNLNVKTDPEIKTHE